jgi:hypothetical protein
VRSARSERLARTVPLVLVAMGEPARQMFLHGAAWWYGGAQLYDP